VTLFCELRSHHLEGLDLISTAIDELNETSGEPPQLLHWRLRLRWIHLWQLRKQASESIRAQIEEILHAARQREDQALITMCLYELGQYMMNSGSYREALAIYETAVAHYREVGDNFNAVRILRGITCCYGWLGEEFLDKRRNSHQEYLNLAREVGAPSSLAHAIHDDAFLVRKTRQDLYQYEHRLLEAHDLWEKLGDRTHVGAVKAELAYLTALQGNHARANTLATEAAQIADDANYTMLHVFVLIVRGLLAILKEDYPQSEQHLKDAIALDDPRHTPLASIWLGISYLGQSNYEEAKQHFHQLLSDSHVRWGTQRIASITMLSALLLAHEGEKDRAAELLGWALAKRDGFVDALVETTPLFIQKHTELKAEGKEAYQVAAERGKSLDLSAVVQSLVDDFNVGEAVETTLPMHVISANEQLPEPLTGRELEVLSLLAEGLTNREIAERLYISTGTVKVHTRHIYSKLGVNNRTEATAAALNLNLT
jgi:ATP/maltotriose-dependent transcriptional regulator MalT